MGSIKVSFIIFSLFALALVNCDIRTDTIFKLTEIYARCNSDAAMTKFWYSFGPSTISLNWSCINSNALIPQRTYGATTPYCATNKDSTESINYLDRIPFFCNQDYVLQHFQLIRSGNVVAWDYTCIAAKVNDCGIRATGKTRCHKYTLDCLDDQSFSNEPNPITGFHIVFEYGSGTNNYFHYDWGYCNLRNIDNDINFYYNRLNSQSEFYMQRKSLNLSFMEDEPKKEKAPYGTLTHYRSTYSLDGSVKHLELGQDILYHESE